MHNKPLIFLLLTAGLVLAGCDSLPSWMGGDDPPEKKLPGERVAVLEYQRALEPDTTLLDTPVELLPPEQNTQWRYEASPLSDGIENLATTGLNEAESVTIGDGNGWDTELIPTPVVADGVLYAMDAHGYISAHNAKMLSQTLWQSTELVPEEDEDIQGGGLSVAGGVVYATSGRGAVVALVAKDGSLLWRQDASVPIRAAPVAAEGKVFVTTIDNQLLAYDAHTGRPQWNHRGIRETAVFLGAVSPAIENGIVIAAYTSGEIYALRADDGSQLWSDTLVIPKRTLASSSLTGIDANPIIRGGAVYGLSNNGLMVADVLSSGRGLWDMEISGYQTPWAAGDYLFVLDASNTLVAIRSKDSAVRWVHSLRQTDDGDDRSARYSGPIMMNSQLVVVNNQGQLFIISPNDGKIIKTLDVSDDVMVGPVVAGGRLYLLSKDATLTAYE